MYLTYRYSSAKSAKKPDILVVNCVQDILMHLLKSSKVPLLRHFEIPEDVCRKINCNEDEMNLLHVSRVDYRGQVLSVDHFDVQIPTVQHRRPPSLDGLCLLGIVFRLFHGLCVLATNT